MAIQAPNTNMIANPYVPDYGNIQVNAMNIKNARQQNELNQKKLDSYESDKEAATRQQNFTNRISAMNVAIKAETPEMANSILKTAFPDMKESELPKIHAKGKDISIESPNGVVIKGPRENVKKYYEFISKDPKLADNPQLMHDIAIDSGVSVERQEPAGAKKDTDMEVLRNRKVTHLKSLNQIRSSNSIDQETWDGASEEFKAVLSAVGAGPNKKMDPATKARVEAALEGEIARLDRKLGDNSDDPFGIKPKGLAHKAGSTEYKPEAPRLYDYSNMMAK